MWYALQLTIFLTIVYHYKAEIAPDALMGHIMLLAGLITLAITKLLTVVFDTLYRVISFFTRPRAVSRPRRR